MSIKVPFLCKTIQDRKNDLLRVYNISSEKSNHTVQLFKAGEKYFLNKFKSIHRFRGDMK